MGSFQFQKIAKSLYDAEKTVILLGRACSSLSLLVKVWLWGDFIFIVKRFQWDMRLTGTCISKLQYCCSTVVSEIFVGVLFSCFSWVRTIHKFKNPTKITYDSLLNGPPSHHTHWLIATVKWLCAGIGVIFSLT